MTKPAETRAGTAQTDSREGARTGGTASSDSGAKAGLQDGTTGTTGEATEASSRDEATIPTTTASGNGAKASPRGGTTGITAEATEASSRNESSIPTKAAHSDHAETVTTAKARTPANPADPAGNILAAAQSIAPRGPAPVHLWDPPFCGDLDMEIRADGTWFYMGTPIGRPAMVRLFSSVLKLEGGRHYLVTPVEKVGIRVEDAPFVAVDVDICGQEGEGRLVFTTNVGESIEAGPENAIRVAIAADGTPRPYLHVRRGLEALIDRKSFYRLAEAARPDAQGRMAVRSHGAVFALEA